MVATQNSITRTLSTDDLRRLTPSVFATHAHEGVSSRYAFIPTTEVIDILRDRGFHPVKAAQTTARLDGRRDFSKHVLRFRHGDFLNPINVGEETPELIVTNSHDRSSAYQIMAGLWRKICSNGLCVMSSDFGSISVRHSGNREFASRILDATQQVIEETPRIMASIEGWKAIDLTQPQREAFAAAALELRDNPVITPPQLLIPRRVEDKKPDLWTVSQVIQENLTKGGLRGTSSTGRRATTRPIRSVTEDLKTNRALWRLTEEMSKLMS